MASGSFHRLCLTVLLLCFIVPAHPHVIQRSGDISTVLQKLEALERRQSVNDAEIANLRAENDRQSALLLEQTRELDRLKAKENDTRKAIVALNSVTASLWAQLSAKQAPACTCREAAGNQSLPSHGVIIKRETGLDKDRRPLKKRQATSSIGFTVYNDLGMLPSPGEIIPFNKVITNEGGAFDVDTGVFNCPQDGLYLFTFTVGEVGINYVWADLMVRGVETVEAAAETFHDSQDLQGASSAVLRLPAGALVWVAAAKLTGQHVPGGGRLTSFTGVLLHD